MKFADFKCEKCGKLYEDLELYKEHNCRCGQKLKRIYSYNNFPEFIQNKIILLFNFIKSIIKKEKFRG